jgi:AraC family transcriptional regulator, regulatory protein of adaptative response / DNA-3-methyladenine glycosylase II
MRAMSKLDGRRPCASTLLARAEAWRPWRAYAAQHLWTADMDAETSAQPQRATITEDDADAPMLVA